MPPPFASFYRAVHGVEPFPWQRRLAELVATSGWPADIGIPTGLGKTAALDVAVWALAQQAERPPAERTAATRVWWVVDRRLLVDAAHDHGERLATLLADPDRLCNRGDTLGHPEAGAVDVEAVAAVGAALRSMARRGTDRPLHIVRLRGGAELGQRSPDPSQPTLVFATVAMYASRLLFRGYGTARLTRPIEAALAGTDSLVLLDEAHIARPLMDLVKAAAACDLGDASHVLPEPRARPLLIPLTATGDRPAGGFDLDETDRTHPKIARRLRASKRTTIVHSDRGTIDDTLVSQARALCREAMATIVFCNTALVARRVFDRLAMAAPENTDVRLLTGRMREREAAVARADILRRAGSGRDRTSANRHLVVVATQTLEVGADLDFDALVTECAGRRALVQRFGRLNRLGVIDTAQAVICGPPAADSPVYAEEAMHVWELLKRMDLPLSLGPETIATVLGRPEDTAPHHPQLLPAHLWEYAKTGIDELDEPDVDLFFSARDSTARRVSVLWRAHLPTETPPEGLTQPGAAIDRPRIYPPVSEQEVIDLPLREMQDFLEARGLEQVHRVDHDGLALERVRAKWLRPGDTIVLDADLGGYDDHGWNDAGTVRVLDLRAITWPLLWLTPEGVANVAGESTADAVRDELGNLNSLLSDEDHDLDERLTAVGRVIGVLRAGSRTTGVTEEEWEGFVSGIGSAGARLLVDDQGVPRIEGPFTARRADPLPLRADAADDWSFNITSATLTNHLGAVGQASGEVAARMGCPPAIAYIVERAGTCHDLGKADLRFQRLLDPEGTHRELMAKSEGVRRGVASRADWPRGARHEHLSGQLVAELLAQNPSFGGIDPDLLLHLVLSHHGHGRPLVPIAPGALPLAIEVLVDGRTIGVRGDLAARDWGQPARFRALCERYGVWGVALLETLVRQSDHVASAATAMTGATPAERSKAVV